MNTVRFVKSFSKGQITIPKEIRDTLGIVNEFWLKLYVDNGKIIAEPVEEKKDKEEYRKKLLTIKGNWLDLQELKKNREDIDEQMKKRGV